MCCIEIIEKQIKSMPGYFARSDGTIRTPCRDHILHGVVWPPRKPYPHIKLKKDGHLIERNVHRLIAEAFVKNPRPDIFNHVDHINGEKTDNRPCNLRWVNAKLNALNRRDAKGYSFNKKWQKYHVYITINGTRHNLGWVRTEEEAITIREHAYAEAFITLYNSYINETPRTSRCFYG